MRKFFLLCICTLSLAPLWAGDDRLLQWMDRIAQQQLSEREATIARIRTVGEAKARQAWVRAKILELLGGLPDYNGPLNARVTGRIERSHYSIEKVIFESLSEFFVVNWGRTADLQNRSALLIAYAGAGPAEQQSRCRLTIDRVRLPADERERI